MKFVLCHIVFIAIDKHINKLYYVNQYIIFFHSIWYIVFYITQSQL